MTETFFIEIEAEGWPRAIGPFGTREAAFHWMDGRKLTGSWNIAPMQFPTAVEHLGRP
jgi:hypothetical protein